ncbi:hypothetical protein NH340_JMT02174 [Sarcoptes scabiei]|nr:hypothetical protein NH340_JMT02174 [Sarcoptes scabiei]
MLVVECNSFADFPSDLSISLRESNLNHVWIEISIACGCLCAFDALVENNQVEARACGRHQVYTKCGSYCPETCHTLKHGKPLTCPAVCLVGCVCTEGFVRKHKGGPCVTRRSCFRKRRRRRPKRRSRRKKRPAKKRRKKRPAKRRKQKTKRRRRGKKNTKPKRGRKKRRRSGKKKKPGKRKKSGKKKKNKKKNKKKSGKKKNRGKKKKNRKGKGGKKKGSKGKKWKIPKIPFPKRIG